MAQPYDYRFKLVFIGDSRVGKSCLLQRFIDDTFNSGIISSLGVDFSIRTVTVDGKNVKLQLWDTAGQERFRQITSAYYRGAAGIVLVYDITNEESFKNVHGWYSDIKEYGQQDVEVMILGNKCDLEESRVVTEQKGRILAAEYEAGFFETSAKSGQNVEEAILTLARAIKDKMDKKDLQS